jgi:signal transduction histidine kinase
VPYGVAMRVLTPSGRRGAGGPPEAFEATLWRGLAVLRLATLLYAAVMVATNFREYQHPFAGWLVVAVMAGWSAVATYGYARPEARLHVLLLADLALTAGCVLVSGPIIGGDALSHGVPTLTITWMACPVIATAIRHGRRSAVAAGLVIGACDIGTRGTLQQTTATGTVIMVLAALAVGQVARLAAVAEQRLRHAAEREAAVRERERFARGIHDSVLQVLALVQRRGAELGGEAAELGRLAGEQEAALRALVNTDVRAPTGLTDLRTALAPLTSATVSLAAPATRVLVPAPTAAAMAAAAGAALENVRAHAGPKAVAWLLVEEDADQVIVSVRDDGPGVPAGRLDEAAAQGRLGVAQSIRGRMRDLGGTATITSVPGQGTEVELRVRRAPRSPAVRTP